MSKMTTPEHVGPRKPPVRAGFLELYVCAGAGFLYCGERRQGAWIFIGTLVANVALFLPVIALAILPLTTLVFIALGGNIIWLIVRIIWVANIAAAHNERRGAIIESLTSPSAESTIS